jgi:hypothetical protein
VWVGGGGSERSLVRQEDQAGRQAGRQVWLAKRGREVGVWGATTAAAGFWNGVGCDGKGDGGAGRLALKAAPSRVSEMILFRLGIG